MRPICEEDSGPLPTSRCTGAAGKSDRPVLRSLSEALPREDGRCAVVYVDRIHQLTSQRGGRDHSLAQLWRGAGNDRQSCLLVQRGRPERGRSVALPVAWNRSCSRWMTVSPTCRRLATSRMDTPSFSHVRTRPPSRVRDAQFTSLGGMLIQRQIQAKFIPTLPESRMKSVHKTQEFHDFLCTMWFSGRCPAA